MKYRLLAIDLDETLLDRDHHISPYNKEMIRRAKDLGVHIIITTGRMYCSALPYYQELSLDTPMINYNGAIIVNSKGDFIYHTSIEPSLAYPIVSTIKKYHCHINLYVEDTLYAERRGRELETYEEISGIKGQVIEDLTPLLQRSTTKIVIISFHDSILQSLHEELASSFKESISLTPTRESFLEVMPGGVSKGVALKRVVEDLEIYPEEVMAIGDGENDITMIEYAGLGVTVENGHDALKKKAEVIAPSNEKDGVGHSIAKYILQERESIIESST